MALSKLQLPADDSVLLLVTHSNLSTFAADIRVSQQTTVEALKDKLWRKTGTAVASMRLQLRDDTGAKIADLDDDAAPLAAYAPYNGYRIHVVDLDPSSLTSGGWLEDTSLVDKYKMSDEAYDKLDTNFRKFKEKMVPKNSPSEDKEKSIWRICAPKSRVKGIRFFECPQGHGAIVRPEKVKVGDFPERDPFEDDEI
ncbi:tubulin-folding cofactor B-like isoform X2 [Miscanthus floridulus]|uniref:tubulin-folding cofactor B-like isoform X2 n=1 Tax=Miscanthus floridulus TaxID=154761 RepID=UPI00345A44E2